MYSSYDIRNTNCNNSRLWQDRIDLYFQTQDRIESFVFETLIYFKFLHLYNPFINGRPLAVTDRLKTFSIFHWVYMVSELLWLTSFFFNFFFVFLSLHYQHRCFSFSHHIYHYSSSDHHQIHPWQLPSWKAQIFLYLKGQHLCGYLDRPHLLCLGSALLKLRWNLSSLKLRILTLAFARSNDTQCYYFFSHWEDSGSCGQMYHLLWSLASIRMHVHLPMQARTMWIHYQLTTLQKCNSSIADYFH